MFMGKLIHGMGFQGFRHQIQESNGHWKTHHACHVFSGKQRFLPDRFVDGLATRSHTQKASSFFLGRTEGRFGRFIWSFGNETRIVGKSYLKNGLMGFTHETLWFNGSQMEKHRLNEGFNGKTMYEWRSFHCRVWWPEGSHKCGNTFSGELFWRVLVPDSPKWQCATCWGFTSRFFDFDVLKRWRGMSSLSTLGVGDAHPNLCHHSTSFLMLGFNCRNSWLTTDHVGIPILTQTLIG